IGFTIQDALGRPALFLPGVTHALIVVSMVSSIAAYALFVRYRTRTIDRYLVLDLTIFLLGAAVVLKELILDPTMDAHPPVGISPSLSAAYIILIMVMAAFIVRLVAL